MIYCLQGVELTQHNLVMQCSSHAVDGDFFYRAFGNFQVKGVRRNLVHATQIKRISLTNLFFSYCKYHNFWSIKHLITFLSILLLWQQIINQDVTIAGLPMFHIFGLGVTMTGRAQLFCSKNKIFPFFIFVKFFRLFGNMKKKKISSHISNQKKIIIEAPTLKMWFFSMFSLSII